MIKYGDLVQYIKDNHVDWNTDLFDVLRGFFEQNAQLSSGLIEQDLFTQVIEFEEPADGEYSSQDLINLFST